MFVIRSRTGYGVDGKRTVLSDNEVYDIESDGKVIKQITGVMLVKQLLMAYGRGRKSIYSNIEGQRTLCDPDMKVNEVRHEAESNDVVSDEDVKRPKVTVPFTISIRRDGGIDYEDSDLIRHESVSSRDCIESMLSFKNGFRIPIVSFMKRKYTDDFSTVSFVLFESAETFSYGTNFTLSITVTEYEKGVIKGSVKVDKEFEDPSKNCSVTLGEFELTTEHSIYRGEQLSCIYKGNEFVVLAAHRHLYKQVYEG